MIVRAYYGIRYFDDGVPELTEGATTVKELFDLMLDFYEKEKNIQLRRFFCEEFLARLYRLKRKEKTILDAEDCYINRLKVESEIKNLIYSNHNLGDIIVFHGSDSYDEFFYYDDSWFTNGAFYNYAIENSSKPFSSILRSKDKIYRYVKKMKLSLECVELRTS